MFFFNSRTNRSIYLIWINSFEGKKQVGKLIQRIIKFIVFFAFLPLISIKKKHVNDFYNVAI